MSWLFLTSAIAVGVALGNAATFLVVRRYWRPDFLKPAGEIRLEAR